jgi:hypothetical protein
VEEVFCLEALERDLIDEVAIELPDEDGVGKLMLDEVCHSLDNGLVVDGLVVVFKMLWRV